MNEIKFRIVEKDVADTPFSCGDPEIDGFIKRSYYTTILQHAYTYKVIVGKEVIGYFMILFRDIQLKDFPEEIAEYYDPEVKEKTIATIHIRFIAIREDLQGKGKGRIVFKNILLMIKNMAKKWPIRIITLDSKLHLVEWYKEEGFKYLLNNKEGQDGITKTMYKDCILCKKKYDDYIQAYCEY